MRKDRRNYTDEEISLAANTIKTNHAALWEKWKDRERKNEGYLDFYDEIRISIEPLQMAKTVKDLTELFYQLRRKVRTEAEMPVGKGR